MNVFTDAVAAPPSIKKASGRMDALNFVFASDLERLRQNASRVFAVLLWFHVVAVSLIAFSNHIAVLSVAPIMIAAAVAGTIAAIRLRGLAARLVIAGALTIGPAMMVYAGHGPWQIDWNMYFFVVFGMLVAYVDWRPLALAAILTVGHILAFDLLAPGLAFEVEGVARIAMRAAMVVLDTVVLFWLVSLMGELFVRTAASMKAAREAAAEAQRLESYAKHGSDLIMQAVNQGLLLCDERFVIQPQYSSELEKIFQTSELAGRNFLEVIKGLLTDRLFRTTTDYLSLLFDASKKERTVLRVNPLMEIDCSFWNSAEHTYTAKVLNFSFRRIVEDGRVHRLFVAVNDVTERVNLERQVAEAERRKDRQVELLLSLLNVEPDALDAFIAAAKQLVKTMNTTPLALEFSSARSGQRDVLLRRLDTIVGCVHEIKGNAASIKFDYFQKRANEFESKIAEVRNHTAMGGDDFIAVSFAQCELTNDLDELEDLRGKFPRMLQRQQIA